MVIAKDNSPRHPIVVPKIVDETPTNLAPAEGAQHLSDNDAHGLPFALTTTRLPQGCEDV